MTSSDTVDRSLLPWSHRQNAVVRVLITLAAGAGSALIGTIAHRMGASSNIPYGLVLAFVILGASTWCARSRCGISGVAWHLIASSVVAWGMALGGANGGDALVPVGFSVDMPYFSEHAGYIWLYGVIIVQVAFLLMPGKWFVMPPRTPVADMDVPVDDADATADAPADDAVGSDAGDDARAVADTAMRSDTVASTKAAPAGDAARERR